MASIRVTFYLIVSDSASLKPTRQTILDAFQQHLIQQAKPGDVVVFHFSGHGSLVLDPNPIPGFVKEGKGVNGTMVPRDRATANPDQVQDIMGRSLFLLMSALQTENVTVVLDSCHSGGGTRGNLEFRATSSRYGGNDPANPSPVELEFQKRWMANLKLSEQEFNQQRIQIAKGVAIGSAQYDQLAADAPFDGFYAGAFTYLLTRYLWQQTRNEGVGTVFVNLTRSIKDVANMSGVVQDPIYAVNPESNGQKPVYFLAPATPPAEAVVRRVDGNQIEFWLGGVSSYSLEAGDEDSIFALMDASGQELGEVKQTSRQGLVGYGKLQRGQISIVKPGILMREKVRGVPADVKLQMGLDASLGPERSHATTVLRSVGRIEIVPVGQGAKIDYLLGRMTPEYLKQANQQKLTDLPVSGSIGLFTAGLIPITATFSKTPGESISDTVERLRPRFKSLLAGKILQLAIGGEQGKNRLNVTTSVVPRQGGRGTAKNVYQFKAGTDFQVKVRNNETRNLYIAVLVIGSSGNLTVLYPYWDAPEDAALVPTGQELLTPKEGDGYNFTLRGAGFIEVLTIASTKPLRNTLKAIQMIAGDRGIGSRTALTLSRGDDSLDVVGALLSDIDRNSRSADFPVSGGKQMVDTTQLAAISNVVEVVK
ncbi:caspase family protein [Leptothermofonsia sp. ETS-13]|uniref:caspase family protein n=1 Tax=Leptothermofonsia sp. ETS-13 TaxID=3035696 RepID=UPI003B9E9D97